MIKTIETFWTNMDPRISCSNRNHSSMDIIVLRPGIDMFGPSKIIGFGDVYIEEGWTIFMDFEDHKKIDVDDNWDESWFWIEFPNI